MSVQTAANLIPNVFGGFAPFPNTMATALLAYQSEAIGYGFGIKFQYGKRKIGAMTNEEFNALTPETIGQIVEIHNTELINRMAAEMPKWISIQDNFIEAHVKIEIAKAKRTPSAWAEIIATGALATAKLTINDPDHNAAAWISSLAFLTGIPRETIQSWYDTAVAPFIEQPPTEEPPTEEPPTEEPPTEEPPTTEDPPPFSTNSDEIKEFIIALQDNTSLITIRFTSPNTNLLGHYNKFRALQDDNSSLEGSSAGRSQLLSAYRQLIQSFYGVTITL